MTRICAITNQKGGVGKTTTAVNLAAALAGEGHRVLLIDLDPQSHATISLGLPARGHARTSFDLLAGECSAADAAIATAIEGLDLVPASGDLASIDQELATAPDRLIRLRRALRPPLPWQVVLIDCPPTLGLLNLNALVAAQGVIIPLQTEFLALEGLSNLLSTIRELRAINAGLRIDGVLLTLHNTRTRLAQQVERDARDTLGEVVFETSIPDNVRLAEAPSHGLSIFDYDRNSRGARAYRDLAAEVGRRFNLGGSA